ncbi:hypothetical protein HUW51_14380 [Adhaeribacter swui]|uniref:Uncharacterized protein n=1 Tax=Adhaeribacter swui TaxID=2086471 RepID=A0A7G7G9L5_9BACT|nr:hypothetical protein [Adhaeribacter swui]QNF33849.1 hypothetical protein HUW51_14380 [Adhaeribacter swui]
MQKEIKKPFRVSQERLDESCIQKLTRSRIKASPGASTATATRRMVNLELFIHFNFF